MNERIKKLYDQCFVVLEHDTPNTGFDPNQFAELIIKECAEVANYYYDLGRCPVGPYIKEHFCVD